MKYSALHSFALFSTVGWALAGIACSATSASSSGSPGASVGSSAANAGSPAYQTNGSGGSGATSGTSNSAILCSGTTCTWSPAPANDQVLQDNGNTMLLCGVIRDVHSTFPDVEPCTNNPNANPPKLCDSSDVIKGIAGGVEQNPTPSDSTQSCGNFAGSTYPNSCFVQTTLGSDSKPQYVTDPTKQQNGTVTTTGAANFHYWYNTDTSVDPTVDPADAINWAAPLCLALTANNDGTYTYNNQSFFPIDDKLFETEGQTDQNGTPRNYGFMTEFHVTFTYEAGQVFNFAGDDDMIVFINQQLVVDRSGLHNTERANLSLDDLKVCRKLNLLTGIGATSLIDGSHAGVMPVRQRLSEHNKWMWHLSSFDVSAILS